MKSATYSLALLLPILTIVVLSSPLQEQMDQIALLQEREIQEMLIHASIATAGGIENLASPETAAVITDSLHQLYTP